MTSRWGGIGTVAVATAVSACGLFILGGVAPTTTIPPADGVTASSTIADVTSVPTTSPPTTEPTTDPTTEPTTEPTTTTTAASTTTAAPMPVPPTVTASSTIVGVGGTVTFEGNCDDPAAPVVIWIVRVADGSTEIVDTGLTRSPWTYTWHAPTDERDASSFVFRFGCGTPDGEAGSPPSDPQARIDVAMVASAAPPAAPSPASPTAPGRPAAVGSTLPQTD